MNTVEELIISYLRKQSKPVKRKHLLSYLHASQINISDREMREVIELLVCSKGHPVLSLPNGYYYVKSDTDPLINVSLEYLSQKARSIFKRATCITKNCRNLQLDLFDFMGGE